jgi:hypothetical protein
MTSKGYSQVTIREADLQDGNSLQDEFEDRMQTRPTHRDIYVAGIKAMRALLGLKMKPRAAAASTQKGAR